MAKPDRMLRCQVDEFADTHWCSASKGDLAVGLSKDKRAFVSVGYEHYPGSKVSVRVDKNDPLQASAKESYSQTRTNILINQMLAGESIMTRYQKWPRESNVDARVSLYGFKEVWELLDRLNAAVSLK